MCEVADAGASWWGFGEKGGGQTTQEAVGDQPKNWRATIPRTGAEGRDGARCGWCVLGSRCREPEEEVQFLRGATLQYEPEACILVSICDT